MSEFFKKDDVHYCTCECHNFGNDIRHFAPCCSLVYQKYIDENRNIDEELLDVAIMEYVEYLEKHLKNNER